MNRPNAVECRDPGVLRETLAEVFTRDFVPLSTARRARWMIGEIQRLTGISRAEIIANAKADAECIP